MNENFIKKTKLNFYAYGYTILISFVIGIPVRLVGLSYNKTAIMLSVLLICFNVWLFFLLPYYRNIKRMEFAVRFHIASSNRIEGYLFSDCHGGSDARLQKTSSMSEIIGFYMPMEPLVIEQGDVNDMKEFVGARGEFTQALTNREGICNAKAN